MAIAVDGRCPHRTEEDGDGLHHEQDGQVGPVVVAQLLARGRGRGRVRVRVRVGLELGLGLGARVRVRVRVGVVAQLLEVGAGRYDVEGGAQVHAAGPNAQ